MPSTMMRTPSRVVNNTCPAPAAAVIVRVLVRFQPCTRAVRTNGSQYVGIAAWKKATAKPPPAIESRKGRFIASAEIFGELFELLEGVARRHGAPRPVEAVLDMVVDQLALGVADGGVDRMQLLRDVEAVPAFFYH